MGYCVRVVQLLKIRRLLIFALPACLVYSIISMVIQRHYAFHVPKDPHSEMISSDSVRFSLPRSAGVGLLTSDLKSNQTINAPKSDILKTGKRPLSDQTPYIVPESFPGWVRQGLSWSGTPIARGHSQWQVVGRHINAFVYSAHFDNMVSPPIIRVVGLLYRMFSILKITCHYYDNVDSTSMHNVSGVFHHFRGLNSYKYVGAYAECPLPADKGYLPYAVSVRDGGDEKLENFLIIHYSQHEDWLLQYKYTFSGAGENHSSIPRNDTVAKLHDNTRSRRTVGWKWNITRCFPAMQFNFKDPWVIAEMVASSMAMGVERFVFYVESASKDVLRMLKVLQRIGLADVYPWNLHMKGKIVFYSAQASAIQECFYRHLRSSRFVLFGDVDELFVPRQNRTLLPLLSKVFTSQAECGAFTFRNVFFGLNGFDLASYKRKHWNARRSVSRHDLKMLSHTQRLRRVWPSLSRSKPAVNPAGVLSPGIHNILGLRKGFKLCEMDPKRGLLHHYRIITKKQSGPAAEVNDTYLWQYTQEIITHFQNLKQQFHDTTG